MKHLFANHDFTTTGCGQLLDVVSIVRQSRVEDGMALVHSPHTTCAILINEHESGFIEDFGELLAAVVPESRYYRHDDLEIRTEGIEPDTGEFPNGHSHVRAGLLSSSSQTIPIVDGELMLGAWQRVFLLELDRARPRKVFMQVIGE